MGAGLDTHTHRHVGKGRVWKIGKKRNVKTFAFAVCSVVF